MRLQHIGPGTGEICRDIGIEGIGTRIGIERIRFGWRRWCGDLPLQRCPHLRIGTDQRMEDRRAAARQAQYEYGPVDSDIANFRVLGAIADNGRQTGQIVLKLRQRAFSTSLRQPALVFQRSQRCDKTGPRAGRQFSG